MGEACRVAACAAGRPSRRKLRWHLVVSYDGTPFAGWQRRGEAEEARRPSVQAHVEAAVRAAGGGSGAVVSSASRTDAGVHARAQRCVASCDYGAELVVEQLAARLAPHVAVRSATTNAPPASSAKVYAYELLDDELAGYVAWAAEGFALATRRPLDVGAVREAAESMTGTHDFAGLAANGGADARATTVRTVRRLDVVQHGYGLRIEVEGDGFLRRQVRFMVSLLMLVGRHERTVADVEEILRSGKRPRWLRPAPARGLRLERFVT